MDHVLGLRCVLCGAQASSLNPRARRPTRGWCRRCERGWSMPTNRQIVVLATGNGLKDTASAIKAAGQVKRVAPTMEAVLRAMND